MKSYVRKSMKYFGWGFLLVIGSMTHAVRVRAELGQPSRSFVVNVDNLEIVRQLYLAGDPVVTKDVDYLVAFADRYLDAEPVSVVYSPLVAASGDPKDYVDFKSYWWPNPNTENGLPWIRRDGHSNPDNFADFSMLQNLSRWTEALGMAYYVTGDERYAAKTGELLRTWFTDPVTGMNPKNEYGQMEPHWPIGEYNVAGFGNRFPTIFDAAGLIESSASWTGDDKAALQKWSSDFVDWSNRSVVAFKQYRDPANHGSNYDLVKTLLLVYADRTDEAMDAARHYFKNRMPGQVSADGSNPLEMKRANNLLYHRYNLGKMMDLVELSRSLPGFDVTSFTVDSDRGVQQAMDFLMPYMTSEKAWDLFSVEEFPREEDVYYVTMLRGAYLLHDADVYRGAVDSTYASVGFSNVKYPVAAITIDGDYDGDRFLTVADIDLIAAATRSQNPDRAYDLNVDGLVDHRDLNVWVRDFKHTVLGDSNLDRKFNSIDLVSVMTQGKYEDGTTGNANWSSGDWNGDGDFTSADFVSVMVAGMVYDDTGVVPAQAVPESLPVFVSQLAFMAFAVRAGRSKSGRPSA